MKVLLINPPNSGRSIPEEKYGIETIKQIFRGEPLALEVLAGNLDGHDLLITDLKADPDGLDQDLENMRPDIVGITAMTCEADAAIGIAEEIKKVSGAKVVIGGPHASCDPEYFNRASIDHLVIGLGKLSFRELIDAIERKDPTDTIPGVARTTPGKPLQYRKRSYGMADLVDQKPPRYDLTAAHRDKYVMSGVGGKMGFVASAFGCTHRCTFCCVPNITGGKYLNHSADAVVRDMHLLGDLPMIRLADANTFGDLEQAKILGQRIIDAGIKTHILADMRADAVVRAPQLFELWKRAGLVAGVIGFEEISDQRLDSFEKRNSAAQNIEAIRILKDLGIRIIGDFIVSPDYTHADFDRLDAFVNHHAIDLPVPSVLTPVPGTPLYEKMKDQITVHDLSCYTYLNAVTPTRLPEKEFYRTYADLLRRFLKIN